MIISTEYMNRIQHIYKSKWLQSVEAKKVSVWCFNYFKQYEKAPGKYIQSIYMENLSKLTEEQAEVIETILTSLSEEYERAEQFNVDYLLDQTETYFKSQQLIHITEQALSAAEAGDILEAEKILINYAPVEQIQSNSVNPLGTKDQIKDAFNHSIEPLIDLGNTPIGDIMNPAMCRDCFVAFMGQAKGSKSWVLQYLAMQGAKKGYNVVIFQAGDLSQRQTERRFGINLAKKSDNPKYCQELFIPVLDCVWNQNGSCRRSDREGTPDAPHPLNGKNEASVRMEPGSDNKVEYEELIKAVNDFPHHKPCFNCLRNGNKNKFLGTIWYKRKDPVTPLSWKECYKLIAKKHKKVIDRIKLITYSSGTLTVSKIKTELDLLERMDFLADIVVVDYFDIMAPEYDMIGAAARDQENEKWKRLRNLNQEKYNLLIGATQCDAQGFDATWLDKRNFSEDRRKIDHVTNMFGLNMTPTEKKKGIMRINEIASRETEGTDRIYVSHRLQIGSPVINSFY